MRKGTDGKAAHDDKNIQDIFPEINDLNLHIERTHSVPGKVTQSIPRNILVKLIDFKDKVSSELSGKNIRSF